MKTVIIFETFSHPLGFIVVEGDMSRFNDIYVNDVESDSSLQDELTALLYDEKGDKTELYNSAVNVFPVQAVRDGAIVIVAGFIP